MCHEDSVVISSYLGLCADCIRNRPEHSAPIACEAHTSSRARFSLPGSPPKDPSGVRCGLCSNDCVIAEGEVGFCGTRTNAGGRIASIGGPSAGLFDYYRDPHPTNCCAAWFCPAGTGIGYPMYAARPASEKGFDNLAIFMYGCNFDCLFCLPPGALIVTDKGLHSVADLFRASKPKQRFDEHEEAYPADIAVITHTGKLARISRIFRHKYEGELIAIKPMFAPEIECTPSHEIFIVRNENIREVEAIPARQVRSGYSLVTPRISRIHFPHAKRLDVKEVLEPYQVNYRKPGRMNRIVAKKILALAKARLTSRQISASVHYHPTYVRRLLRKLVSAGYDPYYKGVLVEERGRIRFKKEKRPGIPRFLRVDELFAELLGYYCSEGHVCRDRDRPNSYRIVFSFGHHEGALVDRVAWLIMTIFGLRCKSVKRATTVSVEVGKSSLALLFLVLCGNDALSKRLPALICSAPINVARSFLGAYLKGDGCETGGYEVSSTVSRQLAMGIYWLMLRMGLMPGLYEYQASPSRILQGRRVTQSRLYIVKVRASDFQACVRGSSNNREHSDGYVLWPIRRIGKKHYEGYVYNMEIEDEDHSYVANFVSLGNCQNWQHKMIASARRRMSHEIVDLSLSDSAITCWCFFGGSPEPQLPFIIRTSRMALEAKRSSRILRICFEWNGCGSLDLVRQAAELAHESGGTIKFDLKCWSESVSRALSGVDNSSAFRNFERLADDYSGSRRGIPLLTATTLLVPGYVGKEEVEPIARFIAEIDEDIPYSLLAFRPDYLMDDLPVTPRSQVDACLHAARRHLRNVNLGNRHLLSWP